jgi:hypothetical protein
MYVPAHYWEPQYKPMPGNRFLTCSDMRSKLVRVPKLLHSARSARMGVGKRILHPRRPKTALYGLTRRPKTPKHPKTLLNHSGRNGFWRPQVAARRSNTAPRPIWDAPTVGAPSGACGRTACVVIPPPPWLALGPQQSSNTLVLNFVYAHERPMWPWCHGATVGRSALRYRSKDFVVHIHGGTRGKRTWQNALNTQINANRYTKLFEHYLLHRRMF